MSQQHNFYIVGSIKTESVCIYNFTVKLEATPLPQSDPGNSKLCCDVLMSSCVCLCVMTSRSWKRVCYLKRRGWLYRAPPLMPRPPAFRLVCEKLSPRTWMRAVRNFSSVPLVCVCVRVIICPVWSIWSVFVLSLCVSAAGSMSSVLSLEEDNRVLQSELSRLEDLLAHSRADRDELAIKYSAISERVRGHTHTHLLFFHSSK